MENISIDYQGAKNVKLAKIFNKRKYLKENLLKIISRCINQTAVGGY